MPVDAHKPWLRLVPGVWAGLLLGMPYTLGSPVPCGAVSLGTSYAWVAFGLFMGALVGHVLNPHRPVQYDMARRRRSIRVAAIVGMGAMLLLAVSEWGNAVLLASEDPQAWNALPHGLQPLIYVLNLAAGADGSSLLAALLRDAVSLVARCEGLMTCLSAACCSFVWLSAAEKGGTGGGESRSSSIFSSLRIILAALAGFLQPLAWLAWLPSSPLPIRPVYLGMDPSEWWGSPGPLIALPSLLTCLLFTVATRRSPVGGGCTGPRLSVAYALGILLFHALSGTWRNLLLPNESAVTTSEVIYLASTACMVIPCLMRSRASAPIRGFASKTPPPTGRMVQPRDDDSTSEEETWLAGLGLSTREADAVRASMNGVPLATVAKELHIRPSTMREYARRAREKLGVASLHDIRPPYHGRLALGEADFEADDEPERNPAASRLVRGLALIGLTCCVALLTLVGYPFWGVERYGELAGAAPLVLSIGCATAPVLVLSLDKLGPSTRKAFAALCAALLLVGCGLMVGTADRTWTPRCPGGGPRWRTLSTRWSGSSRGCGPRG